MLLLPAKNRYIWLLFHLFFFFLFWSKKTWKIFWVHTGKRKSCWKARVLKVEWDREWKQEIFFLDSLIAKVLFLFLFKVILAFPEQILKIFHFCMGYKAYFSTLWLWIFLQLVEPLPVQWLCANSILEPDKESTTPISISVHCFSDLKVLNYLGNWNIKRV